jgi:hypothetical protein
MNGHHIARRTLIRGAGLGIGANLSGGLLSGLVPARAENAGPAAELWSQEYWAQKGNVKLYIFRKRLGAPKSERRRCRRCFWCTVPPFQRFPVTISTSPVAPNIP